MPRASARGATAPRSHSAARLEGPVIVTASLTKSYGLAGLRSGWAIAPPATAERLRRTRDVVDNASSAPSDRLAALAWSVLPQLADARATLLGEQHRARARVLRRASRVRAGRAAVVLGHVSADRRVDRADAEAWVQRGAGSATAWLWRPAASSKRPATSASASPAGTDALRRRCALARAQATRCSGLDPGLTVPGPTPV